MKNRILFVLGLFALLYSLSGCVSQKKAEKFYRKFPVKFAVACNDAFPTRETIVTKDSLHLDTAWVGLETRVVDTIYIDGKPLVIPCKCPPASVVTKTLYKEVVKTVKDSSEIFLAMHKADSLSKDNEQKAGVIKEVKERNDDLEQKAGRRTWYIIGLFVLIGLYVVGKVKSIIPF